jgi:hypothetical protein
MCIEVLALIREFWRCPMLQFPHDSTQSPDLVILLGHETGPNAQTTHFFSQFLFSTRINRNMDMAQRYLRALQEEGESEFGLQAGLIGATPGASATPGAVASSGGPSPSLMMFGGMILGLMIACCCFAVYFLAFGRKKTQDKLGYPQQGAGGVAIYSDARPNPGYSGSAYAGTSS